MLKAVSQSYAKFQTELKTISVDISLLFFRIIRKYICVSFFGKIKTTSNCSVWSLNPCRHDQLFHFLLFFFVQLALDVDTTKNVWFAYGYSKCCINEAELMEHEPLQGSHLSFGCNFAYECESRHQFFVCKYSFDIVWIDWLNLLCTRRTQHCIFIARPKLQNFIIFIFHKFSIIRLFASHFILGPGVRRSWIRSFHDRMSVRHFSSALFVLYFKRIGKRAFSQFVVLFFLRKNRKVENMAARWLHCFPTVVPSLLAPSPPLHHSCLRRNHRWILFTWRRDVNGTDMIAPCVSNFFPRYRFFSSWGFENPPNCLFMKCENIFWTLKYRRLFEGTTFFAVVE